MSTKRFTCRKAPKVRNAMRNELCDTTERAAMRRSLESYKWDEWDKPRKTPRCWKNYRKTQYRPVEMF